FIIKPKIDIVKNLSKILHYDGEFFYKESMKMDEYFLQNQPSNIEINVIKENQLEPDSNNLNKEVVPLNTPIIERLRLRENNNSEDLEINIREVNNDSRNERVINNYFEGNDVYVTRVNTKNTMTLKDKSQ